MEAVIGPIVLFGIVIMHIVLIIKEYPIILFIIIGIAVIGFVASLE